MVDGPGAFSAGDTLVPIPNTKVKTRCGDDTLTMGKVARCRIDQKPAERQVFGVYAFHLFAVDWNMSVKGWYNSHVLT